MSPSKRKQTPIRINDPIRIRLDAEVARTGLSINTLVNLALDRYLPALGESTPPTEPAPSAPGGDALLDFD